MSRTTIIDNDFGTLWYYPDKKIIHHQFHKFIFGEPFREILMTGIELFEKNNCMKWLSDDSENPVLNQDDKLWGDKNWTPRIMAAGWKYWAIVMPKKVVGQMSMNRVAEEYRERGVEVFICDDTVKALAWLERQG